MKKMVNTRFIIAAIGIAILLPILIFSNTFIFPVAVSLILIFGIYELLINTKMFNQKIFSLITVLYTASCPILARWCGGLIAVAISTAVYVLLSITYSVFSGKTEILNRIYSTAFLSCYITSGLSSLVIIRDGYKGMLLTITVFMIAWLTDTFAFFAGSAFGRHKLIPKISPNKTVEGAIGGTLLTLIISLIVYVGIDLFSHNTPNYLPLIIMTFIASIMAQIGDLALSQVKRYYNIKDFSSILAEHGGFLDRFDSIIITALVITIFLNTFPKVLMF